VLAADDDFFAVPFADRLEMAGLGGDDAIDGAVVLVVVDFAGVFFGRVVEDLNFQAGIGGIGALSFDGGGLADADAVVCAGRELELKLEMEVAVLFVGIEISLAFGTGDDGVFLDVVAVLPAVPAGKGLAVEEGGETFILRGGRRESEGEGSEAAKRGEAESCHRRFPCGDQQFARVLVGE
jgi:hypothetical protein